MVNYYDVLGVPRQSTHQQIKKAFRKRAKEMHPDLSAEETARAEERMRLLLCAYQVLVDPDKRAGFDRTLDAFLTGRGFDYREFLRSRADDPRSQAKLVFHDLLGSRQAEALELYRTLSAAGFEMELHMGREDFMDCAFLLAEVFELKGLLPEAYGLYRKIYLLEMEAPYFRHFTEELVDRLRSLICFRMVETLTLEESVRYLNEAIALNFSGKDNAFFYKKLAEVYSTLGRTDMAVKSLRMGLHLNHRLSGVKKLMERIGYTVCLDNP